jgi:protein-S-isoprenylcysteine O-methyltransferase Ste14
LENLRAEKKWIGVFTSILREYRILISFVLSVMLFLIARPTFGSTLAGLPLIFLGEGIRTWSSGVIRKNNELATEGPYQYTRNPLYLGSFSLGLGFSLMTAQWWVPLVFSGIFYGIYRPTIREEEATLRMKFGPQFEQYRSRVPCFFPGPWTAHETSKAPRVFDWGLVVKHREYQTWLGIAAGILMMIWKMSLA